MQGLSKNVMRGVSSIALLSAARMELEGDSDEDYNLDFLEAPKKKYASSNDLVEKQPVLDTLLSHSVINDSLSFSRTGINVEDLCRYIARIENLSGKHEVLLKQ